MYKFYTSILGNKSNGYRYKEKSYVKGKKNKEKLRLVFSEFKFD